MPIDRDELRLELAKAASVISAQCAIELSARKMLTTDGSVAIEGELRRIADLCRRAAGDVSETVFLRAAEEISRDRDA